MMPWLRRGSWSQSPSGSRGQETLALSSHSWQAFPGDYLRNQWQYALRITTFPLKVAFPVRNHWAARTS